MPVLREATMTQPLSVESPRRAAARRFGVLLTRDLERRNLGTRTLAERVGVSRSLVMQWKLGNNLPRLEVALRVAETLGDPKLATVVRESRSGICANEWCRRPFINLGPGPRRFCSVDCLNVSAKRRAGVDPRVERATLRRRLATLTNAVAAMCHECEPAGLCRMSDCPLRAVSPLTFKEATR